MREFRIVLFLLIITYYTPQLKAGTPLNIEINKNLELFAIIGGLTESGEEIWEYYEPRAYAQLGARTRSEFLSYKEHKAVHMMQELFDNLIGLSTLPVLAIHFEEFPTAQIPKDIEVSLLRAFAPEGTDEEKWAALDKFRLAVNDFYEVAKFEAWFQAHQPMYHKLIAEIKAAIPADFVPTMEQFYGESHLSYNIIPAAHFPPTMGFGPRIYEGDKKHVYNILAPLGAQELQGETFVKLGYNYSERLLQMCLHEFGHSFVNPYVLSAESEAIYSTYSELYEPIAQVMNDQAYQDWAGALVEHVVRAGEVRLMDLLGLQEMSNKYRNYHQKERSFIYLPQILEQLEFYEQNRAQYPTFASFVPTLLKAIAPKEEGQSITTSNKNTILKGRIFNSGTKQTIEYATIGVIGTSIGVISDEEGRFSLDLGSAQATDTLRIAYLGYEPYTISIQELDFEKELEISLYEKAFKLPEIIVTDQLPTVVLGNEKKSRFFTGWGFDGVMRGATRGLVIEVANGPVRLQKFQADIARMGFDSILFRLRIFQMEGQETKEDILPENIFIPVYKKGGISHSFEDKNYWLDNGRYLVALEWIDTWGDGHGLLTVRLSNKGTLYYRDSAEDTWNISTSRGPVINLEVNTLK